MDPSGNERLNLSHSVFISQPSQVVLFGTNVSILPAYERTSIAKFPEAVDLGQRIVYGCPAVMVSLADGRRRVVGLVPKLVGVVVAVRVGEVRSAKLV